MSSLRKKTLLSLISPSVGWTLENVSKILPIPKSSHLPTWWSLDVDAPPANLSTLYDLIANVTHESVAGTTRDKENTVWKAHLRAAGGGGDNEKWFMIQDLIVEETRKEMIFLGETVLQVWTILWFVHWQTPHNGRLCRSGNEDLRIPNGKILKRWILIGDQLVTHRWCWVILPVLGVCMQMYKQGTLL